MKIEIEKIIVNLLKEYLNLPNNYGIDANGNEIPTICIASQNIKLFNTEKLQITVSTLSNQLYSNRRYYYEETDENNMTHLFERVCLNINKQMQIDCYSRNNEARQRYYEISTALNSTLAQQLQEKYGFKIATITNTNNMSGFDGGSDINRYVTRFNCFTHDEKIKEVDYYKKFETTVQNKNDSYITDFNIEIEK